MFNLIPSDFLLTGRKFYNERELVQWENLIADAFHHKTEMKAFNKMEYKVDTTSVR